MIRDIRHNEEYFDKWIGFVNSIIAEDIKEINVLPQSEGKVMCASSLRDRAIQLVIMQYGRGCQLTEIRDGVKQIVKFIELKRLTLANVELKQSVREMYERLDLGTLYENLTCLAFLVSLHATKEAYSFVLNLIGHSGEDALLDHISVALGDTTRKIAPQSKYPKVYDPLVEVITSPEDKRPAKLNKYLEGWYKRMKPIYWHDNHEGGEGAYFGYWCFEAALVVMLYNIDDASFCDNPYYPMDLVRYFKDSKRSQ